MAAAVGLTQVVPAVAWHVTRQDGPSPGFSLDPAFTVDMCLPQHTVMENLASCAHQP